MSLNITVDDFKDVFLTDFDYVENWQERVPPVIPLYTIGEVVYHKRKFWSCQITGTDVEPGIITLPDIAWLPIAGEYVVDRMIINAFASTNSRFNVNLVDQTVVNGTYVPPDTQPPVAGTDNGFTNAQNALLQLTAHYVALQVRTASGGNNAPVGAISGQSVGNIHTNFHIPEDLKNNQTYSDLAQTQYGVNYWKYISANIWAGSFRTVITPSVFY